MGRGGDRSRPCGPCPPKDEGMAPRSHHHKWRQRLAGYRALGEGSRRGSTVNRPQPLPTPLWAPGLKVPRTTEWLWGANTTKIGKVMPLWQGKPGGFRWFRAVTPKVAQGQKRVKNEISKLLLLLLLLLMLLQLLLLSDYC